MAMATSPLTCRSLVAQAQYPSPRLPSSVRLTVSHQKQLATSPKRRRAPAPSHPAFFPAGRRRAKKIPIPETGEPAAGVRVTDRGLAYHLDGAPFEFQYSYTEAPRARPVALREAPFLPFGPEATPRPWTGRKPLPKKQLPEFDSFVLPPPGKKGVKPVQSPGPFLAGMEPRYQAVSREEVLGEPLTKEEVDDLVSGTLKIKRQLNIGRDGLTHNMLENIHAHWKRKRVCKIKCKGVCTVDMDNVCQQLEEKVGGKVIHRQGVYPPLVKRVPDGLTPDEASDMRKRGRQLPPICKLGKNGVYINLVKQVREAFEACDLVRVDCSGLNKSDCRKIGAKLQDLVPCTLVSFEFEHILTWRGNDWKSSLPPLEENNFEILNSKVLKSGNALTPIEVVNNATSLEKCNLVEVGTESSAAAPFELSPSNPGGDLDPSRKSALYCRSGENGGELAETSSPDGCGSVEQSPDELEVPPPTVGSSAEILELQIDSRNSEHIKGTVGVNNESTVPSYMEGILILFKQAVDSGRALVLNEDEFADADAVYRKSVAFTKTAPRFPAFQLTLRKPRTGKNEPDKHVVISKHPVGSKVSNHVKKKDGVIRGSGMQRNDHDQAQEFLSDVVPQGTLRVDELAKLLA
ncbi:hypothetical protein GUJ93_ZPchr0001g31128 [Zizania palustris]|uniref:CRM domain-containing protein n=1 Tax=Zizania palustris TaxID=103762 RepID=A0A8J5RQ33_ZIZPA|nr:hypothetical protein GUJ93_ZPchr0001g31128 [Zizania palustris]